MIFACGFVMLFTFVWFAGLVVLFAEGCCDDCDAVVLIGRFVLLIMLLGLTTLCLVAVRATFGRGGFGVL